MTTADENEHRGWTRRRFPKWVLGGGAVVGVAGATGVELVSHGILPGRPSLDALDGACAVPVPGLVFSPVGPTHSGTFTSRARNCAVGYTIGYPPGHRPGSSIPLIVMLHGFGGNHSTAVSAMTPAQAVALELDGRPLPPIAMVTVDGGGATGTHIRAMIR